MLSYQHIYHAGNKADLHKHAALACALEALTQKRESITYIETHAGRGLYDLRATESLKTGEAAQGWLQTIEDKAALAKLPASYVEAVRAVNNGKLAPFYPGSPKIAAHILRPQDRLYLYDLHPAEFAALKKNMKVDPRIHLEQRDGIEAALALAKNHSSARALVFIDPSYEIKSEYETIPDFVANLHQSMPHASILLWMPMLPALRHETTRERLKTTHPDLQISQVTWASPGAGRGMFGSLLLGINMAAL